MCDYKGGQQQRVVMKNSEGKYYISSKEVNSMGMSAKARKARNEYAKKWREQNKDKVRQHKERYWERQAERMKQEHSG